MSNVIIRVENLGKKYRISHKYERHRYVALRDVVADKLKTSNRWLRSRIANGSNRYDSKSAFSGGSTKNEDFWALKDVSFEVERGEVVGIIGRNGAGKSTLLKILSRITEPSEGRARIRGRVASLLDVGAGFHPELTGRENLFLNGAILGMTREEIRKKFDEIVAFAEVEKFLDTPVKRYSSGMYMRLAFAVAAHLEPEILIVDEVLAVGDVSFQKKCMDYMQKLARSGLTILMVSHNLFAVKVMCRRALLLSAGKCEFDGAPIEGIELYEKDTRLEADPWAIGLIGEEINRWPIVIKFVEFLDVDGVPRTVYDYGERMRVRLHYDVRRPVKNPNFYFAVRRSDNVICCGYSSARDGVTLPLLEKSGVIELLTPPVKLVSELYGTHAIVWDTDYKQLYCGQIGPTFHIRDDVLNPEFGVFHEQGHWSLDSDGDSEQIFSTPSSQWKIEVGK